MIKKALGYFGSISSIVSLFFLGTQFSLLRWIAIVIGILASIYLIINDIRKRQLICCKTKKEIEDYMYDWIHTSGKVNVFSRDLSWVNDKIKHMMLEKGADLTICAEKKTSLITDLQNGNVNIFLYEKVHFNPLSRFTIIKANRPEKQIAIAKGQKNRGEEKHYIYESRDGYIDNWLLQLSTDLIELTKCCHIFVENKETQRN